MTFKAGDVVYCYSHGIVRLMEGQDPLYTLIVVTANGVTAFTSNGKAQQYDPRPSIITLREAEKRGFVRKIVRQKKFRVKFRDMYTKSDLHVTGSTFKDVESFFEANEYYAASEFVSFVDNQLQDCPPPQETVEWEEIV